MTDGRWFDIDADVAAAVEHFRRAVELHGQAASMLRVWKATRLKWRSCIPCSPVTRRLRVLLEMLGEKRPTGDNWHADLIRRDAAPVVGRPAILSETIARAADETRRFRHIATHNYDNFRVESATSTIAAALATGFAADILAFKTIIDPPGE